MTNDENEPLNGAVPIEENGGNLRVPLKYPKHSSKVLEVGIKATIYPLAVTIKSNGQNIGTFLHKDPFSIRLIRYKLYHSKVLLEICKIWPLP